MNNFDLGIIKQKLLMNFRFSLSFCRFLLERITTVELTYTLFLGQKESVVPFFVEHGQNSYARPLVV